MMARLAAFAAAAALAGAAGWFAPGLFPTSGAAGARAAHGAPVVSHARDAIGAAQFSMRALHPPPPPPTIEPPPPPPEPDVTEVFRRELSAVVMRGGRPTLIVVDTSKPGGRRMVARGDRYRDGWRVAEITESSVTLRRRDETRRIDLFAPVAELQTPTSPEASSQAQKD